MKQGFCALCLSLLSALAAAATTDSIRAPDGALVELGATSHSVRKLLGAPGRITSGGYQSSAEAAGHHGSSASRSTRMLPVEHWSYVLGQQKYKLTFRGNKLVRIDWDNVR